MEQLLVNLFVVLCGGLEVRTNNQDGGLCTKTQEKMLVAYDIDRCVIEYNLEFKNIFFAF